VLKAKKQGQRQLLAAMVELNLQGKLIGSPLYLTITRLFISQYYRVVQVRSIQIFKSGLPILLCNSDWHPPASTTWTLDSCSGPRTPRCLCSALILFITPFSLLLSFSILFFLGIYPALILGFVLYIL